MNSYFSNFLVRNKEEAKLRLAFTVWFVTTLPPSEFENDDLLMYNFLEYCSDMTIPPTQRYLEIWLSTELRKVLLRTQARVVGCESLRFEDPVMFERVVSTTKLVMQDSFNQLLTIPAELDDFKINTSAFFNAQRKDRLTTALMRTYEKLNATDNVDDTADYAIDALSVIRDIYDETALNDLDEVKKDMDDAKARKYGIKVTDTGLPAIDNDSKGIYTTQLVGIEAQSGTGKTRFALGAFIYRAATIHKKNCLFIALEQSKYEIECMLTACHVFHMFNVQIADELIYKDEVPDEYKSMVESARYDLFKSGKYGIIDIEDPDVLYVEQMSAKLKMWDTLKGPFDLIAIDYMGLLESMPREYQRSLQEHEIIKMGFRWFKRYVRKEKKAGIAISQFNKEGVQAGKADKEITTDMAQGGMTVYRNTDYNIAISMTDTMRLQQKRRVSQPKVRSTKGFPPFVMDTRLGFLYFKQVVSKEI